MYDDLQFDKSLETGGHPVTERLNCIVLWACLLIPVAGFAADIGESVPSKCKSSDVDYSITNIVPSGVCNTINDTFTVDFDVNVWGNPSRYNLAVGYTLSSDPVLIDLSCLQTGTDLDGVGCDDYPGTGTVTNPLVTASSFNVSCDADGNGMVDPEMAIDLFLGMDANAGGTSGGINAPKCLLQEGNSLPLAPAQLTLTKTVINDNLGTSTSGEWTLEANIGGGPAELSGLSDVTSNQLPAGEYLLTETGPEGYILSDINCTGGSFDANTSILSLAAGDAASCDFVNDDEIPITTLTLNKILVNDQGGTLTIDDFDISIDGVEVPDGITNIVSPYTDIVISELALPGYIEGTWNCVDATGLTNSLPTTGNATGTTVYLAEGAAVDCTITNNDNPTEISLVKSVNNESPDPGEIVTYQILVYNTGTEPAFNVTIVDILPATLNYVSGSITGAAITNDSDPDGIGLRWSLGTLPAGNTATLSFLAIVGTP